MSSSRATSPIRTPAFRFASSRPTRAPCRSTMSLPWPTRGRAARAGWTDARRREFANDPLNLLAVDGRQNQAKGDADASEWLPPRTEARLRVRRPPGRREGEVRAVGDRGGARCDGRRARYLPHQRTAPICSRGRCSDVRFVRAVSGQVTPGSGGREPCGHERYRAGRPATFAKVRGCDRLHFARHDLGVTTTEPSPLIQPGFWTQPLADRMAQFAELREVGPFSAASFDNPMSGCTRRSTR